MNFLESMLGGNQQQEMQGFVNRYMQGAPSEGYSDAEVMQRYQQVAPNIPHKQYIQAAEQAFERLSPEQRSEFAQFVGQQAQQHGIQVPGMGAGGATTSGGLAQLVGALHQQKPGLLGEVLGGLGGGQGTSSGVGSMLGNPTVKAALAGIAAMAVRNMTNRGQQQ